MEKPSAIEEVYKEKGLISIQAQYEVKDKIGLSMVYTPGVGECCTQIKNDPQRLWSLTAAQSLMFVISNGSNFNEQYLKASPSFMLPELELQCFAYKSLANLNAVPLVFNSNIIQSSHDLAWLVKHISPCVGSIEVYEVADAFLSDIEKDLSAVEAVVVLPSTRKIILECFAESPHKNYFASLLIGLICKVNSKLRIFGAVAESFLKGLLERVKGVLQSGEMDEFSVKEFIIQSVFDQHEVCEPHANVKILHETIIDFISHKTSQELFYRSYKKSSAKENSIFIHEKFNGMIKTSLTAQVSDLKTFLCPKNLDQVRQICQKIFDNPALDTEYSIKKNYCAIVTDGTAILGFGNIGPKAGMPVMEGKICLFKQLGHINVIPLCVSTKTPEDTIKLVKSLADSFNAINLEDISAPNCFVIEETLNKELPIPIFHDDQHGTAIVVLAALINCLKLVKKDKKEITVVVNGAGAAGKAIVDLLLFYGVQSIIVCDTKGAIYEGREDLEKNLFKKELAGRTNSGKLHGELKDVIKGADVFVGVSVGNCLTEGMVSTMNKDSIVFALANPEPEIMPQDAKLGGAKIVATGRSDFPNQINNSLAFPGVFKGLTDSKIKNVTLELKLAAAMALSETVEEGTLSKTNILPYTLDLDVAHIIAESILKTSVKE